MDYQQLKAQLLRERATGQIDQSEFDARMQALDEMQRLEKSPRQPDEYNPLFVSSGAFETRQRDLRPPVLAAGLAVDRFELVEFLGQGGMGQVWKAIDPTKRDDRRDGFVVLKFLPDDLRTDTEALDDFRSAYRRMVELQHQHICPVYDLGESADFGCFQVMKFVPGVSLHAYRRKLADAAGRLPLELVVELLRPAAQALDHAHRQGLIHRDVKPGNMMVHVDDAGAVQDVQVIDFGLAAEMQTVLSRTSRVKMSNSGTMAYMAPEQWQGQFQDGASDQYGLATVAHELLTGRLPFSAPNEMALGFAVVNSELEPDEELSKSVNEALSRGLAKSRKARFDSCVALVEGLTVRQKPEVRSKSEPDVVSSPKPERPPLLTAPFTPDEAATRRKRWAEFLGQPEQLTLDLPEGNGVEFMLIPPGVFDMGSPYSADELLERLKHPNWTVNENAKKWFAWESPQHRVLISQPKYVGKFAVTRGQFRQFVDETGYRTEGERDGSGGFGIVGKEWKQQSQFTWRTPGFEQDNRHPVVTVSWNDAQEFVKWLTEKTGRTIRLLTEVEWEYACRAGTTTFFYNGDELEAVAEIGNTADASFKQQYPQFGAINADDGFVHTAPVGQFQPNAFGLYDMLGNTWEWCQDWFTADWYAQSLTDDPIGPPSGSSRVCRGGSWDDVAEYCRCAYRSNSGPAYRLNHLGFRVVREL
ncbi:MAG: SUMF1/EgtB/PvdO family nonheme iron enzyme [Rhodopirellula sp.]|nr:SUMF1/EgtB/PvdO family nonheme iron enzyme [Rhodopirellula sp.]